MTERPGDPAIEALAVDHYLDRLLAGDPSQPPRAPHGAGDAADHVQGGSDVAGAAATIARAFVRVHPSFRFEERLAARLAAAAGERLPVAAGAEGLVIPFRPHGRRPDDPDPELAAIAAGHIDPAADPRSSTRPLLIGGALTSALLSLAGVAWVAWRAGRRARAGGALGTHLAGRPGHSGSA